MNTDDRDADQFSKRGPTPIDAFIGGRVRAHRQALGMTQEALADRLGLTFQQVQKYERGANRVSASRLMHIAGVMRLAPSAFLPAADGTELPKTASSKGKSPAPWPSSTV